ncbi:MAG: glycosyltransferase [Candidatus Delongbacteria bacterium]
MTDRKINIAFILPALDRGGVSSAAVSLINKLDDTSYNKFLILYDGTVNDYKPECEMIDLGTPKRNCKILKIISQIKRHSRLKKIKKEKDIDISISFKDNPNLTSLFSKQNDRIIMTVHTTPSRDYKGIKGDIYKYLIRKYFERADRIVTVSDGIKNDLILNYGLDKDKIQTIYNFVDTGMIKTLALEPVEDELKDLFYGGQTVITVGRLSEAKGQQHLIRAFSSVVKEAPDSKLIIVGDGERRQYLEALVRDLGLTDRVFLTGSRDDPYKYMKNSDIFVLSSVYEGFGIVIIEAMACGLPVISSDCPSGPAEILSGGCGVLVPVPDGKMYSASDPLTDEEKILSKEIVSMLKDENERLRLGLLSFKRSEDFSAGSIVPQWENLIYELVKGRSI